MNGPIHIPQLIKNKLQSIKGLYLVSAARTGNMRMFGFGPGPMKETGKPDEKFALHVQCPWRLEGPEGTITGYSDLYSELWELPEGADVDSDTHSQEPPNVQDYKIRQMKRATWDALVVEQVEADGRCGIEIYFSEDHQLVVFPCGTKDEDWRFFEIDSDDPHLVVSGGRPDRQA